jgi:hypothetical protein
VEHRTDYAPFLCAYRGISAPSCRKSLRWFAIGTSTPLGDAVLKWTQKRDGERPVCEGVCHERSPPGWSIGVSVAKEIGHPVRQPLRQPRGSAEQCQSPRTPN